MELSVRKRAEIATSGEVLSPPSSVLIAVLSAAVGELVSHGCHSNRQHKSRKHRICVL